MVFLLSESAYTYFFPFGALNFVCTGRNLESSHQGCLPCLLQAHLHVAKTLACLDLSHYETCALGMPREEAEYVWPGRGGITFMHVHDAGTQHIPDSQP
jgi:hypothetical protein